MQQQPRIEARVWSFGSEVLVTAPSAPGADETLERLLRPWHDSRAERTSNESFAEGDRPAAPTVELGALDPDRFESIASRFSVQVTLASLELHRGRLLMFHAGGVARPDGAVIAIAGPSGQGKTTTMRQIARDYGYVSDETIAIDAEGRVLPYRKPLSVITEGHVDKLQIAPSTLGLRELPDAVLRLAGLVILDREPKGVQHSSVEPVPLSEALTELVQQTSYLVELPDPLRRIAELARETGGVRRLRAGVPERITEVVEQLFVPGTCEPWEQVMPVRESQLPVAAGPVVDAIECADGTVVLTSDRRLQVISGAAPVIWRGLCEGDDAAALDARVESVLGAPPEGTLRDAIDATCATLVEAGLLVARTE